MGTELLPETLHLNELTRLCAREDYIESCRRERFKTYITGQQSVPCHCYIHAALVYRQNPQSDVNTEGVDSV
jgi:hypothetical protein